jgi:hypothetical protein
MQRQLSLVDLAPTIQELHATGCESLRAIAAGLEERGIPAVRKYPTLTVAKAVEMLEAAGGI